jgi:hypothetical protein
VSLCDQLPRGGIELGRKFDLINCFSVFSHLAEDAHLVVLEAIRGLVTENGLVFISLRTRGYWEQMHAQFGTAVAEKLKDHDERGFAFAPGKSGQNLQEHYGDSSTSLEYVRRNWTRWNVEAVEFSHHQPNQIFLCLSPRL